MFIRPGARHDGLNGYERCKYVEYVDGECWRPYVYRVLFPMIVGSVSDLVPHATRIEWAERFRQNPRAVKAFTYLQWDIEWFDRYFIGVGFIYMCFLGFAKVVGHLATRLLGIPASPGRKTALEVAALLGLPPFFVCASYPYDPVQLLLFTSALFFLVTRQLWPLAMLYPLCCLNKETAFLILPLSAYFFWPDIRRPAVQAGILWMCLAYAVIQSLIRLRFAGNPGPPLEFHLADYSIHYLSRPWNFVELLTLFAFGFLIFFRWNKARSDLRILFLGTFPPLFAMAFFFGWVNEWRAFYEGYPAAFCLSVLTVDAMKSKLSNLGSA